MAAGRKRNGGRRCPPFHLSQNGYGAGGGEHFFPNSVSLKGSNGGKKELSPFSGSTGGDRRLHSFCVPPALGSFVRRAVISDPGPWICDTGHTLGTSWTLGRDPGRWIP